MKKFAIKLTKGDDYVILAVRNTKDEACVVAEELKKKFSKDAGLMSLIEAEFDESDNMIGNGYKLHEVIR